MWRPREHAEETWGQITSSLYKVPDNSHASYYSKTFKRTIKQFVLTVRIWFLLTKLHSHNSVFLYKPFRSTILSCHLGAGEVSRVDSWHCDFYQDVLEWKTGSCVWNGILAYSLLYTVCSIYWILPTSSLTVTCNRIDYEMLCFSSILVQEFSCMFYRI